MPRYELSEGKLSKFWEITLSGKSLTTAIGKLGTDGRSTTKSFKTDAAAKKAYDKLVADKAKQGYTLAGSSRASTDGGKAAQKPAKPMKVDKAAPPVQSTTSRQVVFVDGTSHTFWEIILDGKSLKTRYGKIGTDGQETAKAFGSRTEAFMAYAKLVTEKTTDGYEAQRGGPSRGRGDDD